MEGAPKKRYRNRDRKREQRKRYRARHPDAVREEKRRQRNRMTKQDIEKERARGRAYYLANREKIRERNRLRANLVRRADPQKYLEQQRRWRLANSDKVRAYARDGYSRMTPEQRKERRRENKCRSHGIDLAEYERLLVLQGGVCAICGSPPNGSSLHIDHDHTTGRIRGLLCANCNPGLGFFRDDPKLLELAIAYLTKTAENSLDR